jgi:glycosyltransferase involved in cell wall biosynthesis
MKIYLVGNEMNDRCGGGWTWLKNFGKGGWDITLNPDECDVYFVTSVSMLDKMSQIHFEKKVVLRIDNVLKDSANRRLYGLDANKYPRMEIMKKITKRADAIVWQSNWAKNFLSPFIGKTDAIQKVIMNGVDEEIFNTTGPKIPNLQNNKVYLYVRSSNHDNKGWHIAWYEYQLIHQKNPKSELRIAGRFSPENIEHNLGFISDAESMALNYRSADYLLFPFYNDAASNTLLEARSCGLEILLNNHTGGNDEIMNLTQEQMTATYMNKKYLELFKELNV